MEKNSLYDIVYSAIVEVSPYAAERYTKDAIRKNKALFFVDMGINSIEYTEIVNIVMSRLDLDIPLYHFVKNNNVCQVVDFLYEKRLGRESLLQLQPKSSAVHTPL